MANEQRVAVSAPPPALLRHERMDDLLAASSDPAPRKTRRIEWIGEQSPFDNPIVSYNVALGLYTETQLKAIRWMAATAHTRLTRSRLAEHDHQHAMASFKHLNRTYHFTKEAGFVCDVDYSDVDVLLGSDVGHEFRDVTDLDPDAPHPFTLAVPPVKVIVLTEDRYKQADERLEIGQTVARTARGA